mmetsp:Transcript_27195/g.69259  ORF Transcript_27195/g.69259 Transcript_27195/m.69259 type:complete len:317 (-) Transcript_27195:243-1193(-)
MGDTCSPCARSLSPCSKFSRVMRAAHSRHTCQGRAGLEMSQACSRKRSASARDSPSHVPKSPPSSLAVDVKDARSLVCCAMSVPSTSSTTVRRTKRQSSSGMSAKKLYSWWWNSVSNASARCPYSFTARSLYTMAGACTTRTRYALLTPGWPASWMTAASTSASASRSVSRDTSPSQSITHATPCTTSAACVLEWYGFSGLYSRSTAPRYADSFALLSRSRSTTPSLDSTACAVTSSGRPALSSLMRTASKADQSKTVSASSADNASVLPFVFLLASVFANHLDPNLFTVTSNIVSCHALDNGGPSAWPRLYSGSG